MSAPAPHAVAVKRLSACPEELGWDDPCEWAEPIRERRQADGGPTITGIVSTFNEAHNIEGALRSLGFCDEVVVVDMYSEDGTARIAESLGAQVHDFENVGYCEPARNFAISKASGDWIFILDGDERVPEGLALRLDTLARAGTADAFDVPNANWLCGRWLRGTGWGADWHIRFFRRGAVRWSDQIHTAPEVLGRLERMPRGEGVEILHFNYSDLHQFVEKTNRYTSKEAAEGSAPPLDWLTAVTKGRNELRWRWSPELDGAQSAALSVAMLFYRVIAEAKRWEVAGWPEVGAPATAREALADLANDSRPHHAAGLAAFEAGEPGRATEHLRCSVAEALDLTILNDLAVVLSQSGRVEDARALLRTCLVVDPGMEDARENLAALSEPGGEAA